MTIVRYIKKTTLAQLPGKGHPARPLLPYLLPSSSVSEILTSAQTAVRSTTPSTLDKSTSLNTSSNTTVPPLDDKSLVAQFFKTIGRDTVKFADKFSSLSHFKSCDSDALKSLGINSPSIRKYMLGWRELDTQGIAPYGIPIPKRRKKLKQASLKHLKKASPGASSSGKK